MQFILAKKKYGASKNILLSLLNHCNFKILNLPLVGERKSILQSGTFLWWVSYCDSCHRCLVQMYKKITRLICEKNFNDGRKAVWANQALPSLPSPSCLGAAQAVHNTLKKEKYSYRVGKNFIGYQWRGGGGRGENFKACPMSTEKYS